MTIGLHDTFSHYWYWTHAWTSYHTKVCMILCTVDLASVTGMKVYGDENARVWKRPGMKMNGYEMSRIREDIHKRMWITSCGYTLENVNFPGWGNSLKCKFPHMRIYSYYCEFPLVEVHPKMCNSAVWIFTKFSEFPHAEIPHADIHVKRWISQNEEIQQTLIFRIWGFTLTIVHFPKMCISAVRIYTIFGVLPHAEIHSLMWIPSRGKVYFHGRGFAQF